MNGDPRRGHGLIALAFNFRHPSFDSHGGGGREGGPRMRRSERRTEREEGERERELVQVVQQSQDLFDAVLNGRLEIKKLRINASWGLVGQSSPFFLLLFLFFSLPSPLISFYSSFVSPLLLFFPSSFLGTIASASSFNSRPQSELRFRAIVYRWRALPGLAEPWRSLPFASLSSLKRQLRHRDWSIGGTKITSFYRETREKLSPWRIAFSRKVSSLWKRIAKKNFYGTGVF